MNESRFWTLVQKTGTCWFWRGGKNHGGYGTYGGRKAHRIAYELMNGSIPSGKQIDHLCRVRNCVNPSHMEAIDQTTNIRRGISPTAVNRRKTRCIHGHPLDLKRRNGERDCLTCRRARDRRRYYRHRTKRLTEREARRQKKIAAWEEGE